MEIFLTILATIVSGVFVYVFCEWMKEIWLMPFQEYKKQKAKIAAALTLYANCYSNPVDLAKTEDNKLPNYYEVASVELRKLAAELRGLNEIISWCRILIPRKNELDEVASCLIGLSNSMNTPYNTTMSETHISKTEERENEIKKKLRFARSKADIS